MKYQLIWGAILLLTGIGVFYRIPLVINKIKTIEQFSGIGIYFAYFSFYFIGAMLTGGGIMKLYKNINKLRND
ncbi:MAG: hypothetical protein U9Q05_05080 [Thermodesulfobacteriota bacterium]|nr:hypothetical protein [Thermodesulfobacteriota bacterium]